MLLQETDRLIQEDHGGAHGIEKIEKAIRVSKTEIFLYGEKVSTKVAQNALIPMRKSMREDGMDADVVLLAGGGAEAYQNAVKELFTKSRIVLPNESVASNARAFGSAADREEVIVDDSKWDGKISNLNISDKPFRSSIVNCTKCSIRRVVIGSAPLLYWGFILFYFLATLGLLSNRVQRVNLHSVKIRQCRLTQN